MAKNVNFSCGGFSDSDLADAGDILDAEPDGPLRPEFELFLAVIWRAWEDAFVATNQTLKNSDRHCQPDMIRAEARRWLTLNFGEWREDREDICDRAGVDPNAVRSAAVRRLELAGVEDAERDRLERESIDRAIVSLVERAHRLTRGAVGGALGELAQREDCLA